MKMSYYIILLFCFNRFNLVLTFNLKTVASVIITAEKYCRKYILNYLIFYIFGNLRTTTQDALNLKKLT